MSIRVTFTNGVFEPVGHMQNVSPGEGCTVFSDEELGDFRETLGWLKAMKKSFEFWNGAKDDVYDGPRLRQRR